MDTSSDSSFGPWRKYLWPVHRHELAKILPMMGMLFLCCFTYGILKNLKDAVVVTAKASGAEVIPFLKLWAILPGALLSTWLYTYLTSRVGQEKSFYLIVGGFISFFGLFTFVLYPMGDHLHPHELADCLTTFLPKGLGGLVALFRNWTYTTFYVSAELWGSMVLSVMFWGFANQVTPMKEARRFYGVLAIASNSAAIAAGQVGLHCTFKAYQTWLPFGQTPWEQTLDLITLTVILSGLVIMGLYRWMHCCVLSDEGSQDSIPGNKKKKPKLTFSSSLRYLIDSPYIRNIAMLIIGYNLVINLVEVVWKDQLRILCPNPSDYNAYMSHLTFCMGVISTLTAFVISPMIKRWGWGLTAAITPVMMLLTSVGFFLCMFWGQVAPQSAVFYGTSATALAVFFGAAQNCLSKACKYSVFDTTKEMAFIPLNPEAKMAGKAAIDGVGSRVAKSGSSALLQGLLIPFGSLAACAPVVSLAVLAVTLSWLKSVRSLNKQFHHLANQEPKTEAAVSEPETEATRAVAV